MSFDPKQEDDWKSISKPKQTRQDPVLGLFAAQESRQLEPVEEDEDDLPPAKPVPENSGALDPDQGGSGGARGIQSAPEAGGDARQSPSRAASQKERAGGGRRDSGAGRRPEQRSNDDRNENRRAAGSSRESSRTGSAKEKQMEKSVSPASQVPVAKGTGESPETPAARTPAPSHWARLAGLLGIGGKTARAAQSSSLDSPEELGQAEVPSGRGSRLSPDALAAGDDRGLTSGLAMSDEGGFDDAGFRESADSLDSDGTEDSDGPGDYAMELTHDTENLADEMDFVEFEVEELDPDGRVTLSKGAIGLDSETPQREEVRRSAPGTVQNAPAAESGRRPGRREREPQGRGRDEGTSSRSQPERSAGREPGSRREPTSEVGREDRSERISSRSGRREPHRDEQGRSEQGRSEQGREPRRDGPRRDEQGGSRSVQGRGEQGRGEQGRGEQGRGEQGRGEQGRGEQGRGEQGRGEQGRGEQGRGGSGQRPRSRSERVDGPAGGDDRRPMGWNSPESNDSPADPVESRAAGLDDVELEDREPGIDPAVDAEGEGEESRPRRRRRRRGRGRGGDAGGTGSEPSAEGGDDVRSGEAGDRPRSGSRRSGSRPGREVGSSGGRDDIDFDDPVDEDLSDDDAGSDGKSHKSVTTWHDAISAIIDRNMAGRRNSTGGRGRGDSGGGQRGDGARGGGRGDGPRQEQPRGGDGGRRR